MPHLERVLRIRFQCDDWKGPVSRRLAWPTAPATAEGKGGAISSKVFVGNLSFDTTQEKLQDVFSQVGEVSSVVLPSDRLTGRPRGFAFVEFTSDDHATEAIRRFEGSELDGRRLRVNEASSERPTGGGAGPRSFGSGPASFGSDRPGPRPPKRKGSRRNSRARKRSIW